MNSMWSKRHLSGYRFRSGIALAGACLMLAACTQAPYGNGAPGLSSPFSPSPLAPSPLAPSAVAPSALSYAPTGAGADLSEAQRLDASSALARLSPNHGPALSVIERRYGNGLSQRVIYKTPGALEGENQIDIHVIGRGGVPQIADTLTLQSSQRAALQTQMNKALPGRDGGLGEPGYGQNSYGPYGLVYRKVGRSAGCVFGWQNFASERKRQGFSLFGKRSGAQSGGLSYRVRFCAPGFTLAHAHGLMRRLSIANLALPGSLAHPAPLVAMDGTAGLGQDGLAADWHHDAGAKTRAVKHAPVRTAVRPDKETVAKATHVPSSGKAQQKLIPVLVPTPDS